MPTKTLWVSPTDWVSGEATLRINYPSVERPATEITTTARGDLKWVFLGLHLPPCTEIKAVRINYQVSNSRSFISQVRLTEMTTPDRALVRHDDPTDLTSVNPTCYVSEVANLRAEGAMTLALRLNFGNRADKIILGAVGVDLRSYAAATTWTPDRRPVAVIPCFNGNPNNIYGLSQHWLTQGVPWLRDTLTELWNRGFRRFMINLPAGREKPLEGTAPGFPSAQWQVLDTAGIHTIPGSVSVRQNLADLLTPWLADRPEAQVLFYFGFRIKRPDDRNMEDAVVPNMNRADHRMIVQANMDGFINLTPNACMPQIGFRLESASTPDELRNGLVAFSDWFRAESISIGGEAIPVHRNGGFTPVLVDRCPWVALYRFHRQRDPDRRWEFDPVDTEVGVWLHSIDRINSLSYWSDDAAALERFRINDPAEVIAKFRSRGNIFFIYYSFNSEGAPVSDWEPLVLATT